MELRGYRRANKPIFGLFSRHYITLLPAYLCSIMFQIYVLKNETYIMPNKHKKNQRNTVYPLVLFCLELINYVLFYLSPLLSWQSSNAQYHSPSNR